MKYFLIAFLMLALTGCQTARDFFGADNPCQMAENAYSAFLVATTVHNVSPKAKAAASAGLAAVREQCADGQVDKVTLSKLVNAYVKGLQTYRSEQ